MSSRRRAPVQEVQKENVPVASAPTPAIPEFFAKPEGLRPAAPAPKPTANKPLTEPGARRAAARVKRDAKASDHAQRQSEFRQRWPRIFSYKTWHKDVRVVYTTNEDVIERELRGMEGCAAHTARTIRARDLTQPLSSPSARSGSTSNGTLSLATARRARRLSRRSRTRRRSSLSTSPA